MTENILDLYFSSIEQFIQDIGEPKYRAKQIWEGIYKRHYIDWESYTTIPKNLISRLSKTYRLLPLTPIDESISSDGRTLKILFRLYDGITIETVHLINSNRNTICISTQAGCAVGCAFCATGNLGFRRNLFASEIIGQILFFSNRLAKLNQKITNIVLMGMGEPFLNYKQSLKSISRFNDPTAFDIGARRITVSTIGIIDKIKQFADEQRQYHLAISLHAPNDFIRRELIPIAQDVQIKDLIEAAKYYIKKTNRRISYEYVLIDRINSEKEHARALVRLLKYQNCHVNLIALNPNPQYNENPPDDKKIKDFNGILQKNGIPCTIRNSQGASIKAGCGQLAGNIKQDSS